MTNLASSPVFEQFVSRLLEEKKFLDLEPAILAQMKEDLLRAAEDRVKAAIFENIPGEKLPEFNRLLEAADDELLQKFVAEAIPNLTEVTAQALLDLRTSYLS